MKVLTWNLNNRSQAQADLVIHREPDVVVLTEVQPSRIELWGEALKGYDIAQTTSINERPRTVSDIARLAGGERATNILRDYFGTFCACSGRLALFCSQIASSIVTLSLGKH